MKLFLDESGDFRVPAESSQHATGIVACVGIPETIEADVANAFRLFRKTVPKEAIRHGEVRGHLLDESARFSFARLISETDGILIRTSLLDLASIAGREDDVTQALVGRIEQIAARCKYERMRNYVAALAKQVANLSPQSRFRLRTWAECIDRALRDSIVLYSSRHYDRCWEEMHIEIDAVQKGNGREKKAFEALLPGWITARSVQKPFLTIQDVHTDDHPFVRNFGMESGIDVGKLCSKLRLVPSYSNWGIQMADVAAAIVRRAVVGVVTDMDLSIYGLMMTKALQTPEWAPGLFTIVDGGVSDKIAWRYAGLPQAIHRARLATNDPEWRDR